MPSWEEIEELERVIHVALVAKEMTVQTKSPSSNIQENVRDLS